MGVVSIGYRVPYGKRRCDPAMTRRQRTDLEEQVKHRTHELSTISRSSSAPSWSSSAENPRKTGNTQMIRVSYCPSITVGAALPFADPLGTLRPPTYLFATNDTDFCSCS